MLVEAITTANAAAQHAGTVNPDYYAASFEHAAGALEIIVQKASFTLATVFLAYRIVAQDVREAFRRKDRDEEEK